MLSTGGGVIMHIARHHKMNVAILTDSELEIIVDVLGMILGCACFMEAQGYIIESYLLYQDTQRPIF